MSDTSSIAERKLFQATIAFLSLRTSLIIILGTAFITLLLYILSVLLSALFDLCGAIALTWADCTPIEKILMLALAWAFIAQAISLYRRVHDARV